ncbi:hypothetical protein OAD66_09530 [Bacteroidia bacterium]|nr:hypothetical protein [Bacteroidia bacterium]MDB9883358.1 hypothetical protein [Bacteroidia bacterium]
MENKTGIKYGGRQKGTPNKATARLREAFTELLEDNIGKVQELFDKVVEKNPEKALELMLKLSEFVLPKLRAIEVNNESEEAKHTSLNINIIDTGVPLASCEADVVD